MILLRPSAAADVAALKGRRVIAAMVCVQLAAALGYYAVMAHLVTHLRDDVGLLAGTIALVLGLRVAVQYGLFLPFGWLVDRIGPGLAGSAACVLRVAAFTLLGLADGLGGFVTGAVLLAVGGALFHPAAQSLLAALPDRARPGGFGTYVVAGQVAAVAGPPVGLMLLSGGFVLVASASAAAWAVSAVLFWLLRRLGGARPEGPRLLPGVAEVLRDRAFLRFAVVTAPGTLLAGQVVSVVPLTVGDAALITVFFCTVAVATAGVQPLVARRATRPWVMRAGMLCFAAGYLLLAAVPAAPGVLVAAAVLNGLGNGLTTPAAFQTIVRYAPEGRIGVYNGLYAFMSGLAAFFAGLAVGQLFDAGAVPAALLGLAALGALSAAATPGGPRCRARASARSAG
ncbi:MFS transporter [Nonomuraea typhae]|uniref:MFS transporter n=1 Tax=Nonomuraea typhae TaxID=2603600 RepID=UPI0012FBDBB0|nr:MFS transporter [Nonomuraea typhae]